MDHVGSVQRMMVSSEAVDRRGRKDRRPGRRRQSREAMEGTRRFGRGVGRSDLDGNRPKRSQPTLPCPAVRPV